MKNKTTLLKAATIVMFSVALIACGGGNSYEAPNPTPPVTPTPPSTPTPVLSNIQGFWNSTLSGTSSASAVILPNGQAWVVYETAGTVTALAQANLSASAAMYSSSGKYYSLPGGSVQDYSMGGSLPAAGAASVSNNVRIGSGTATAMTWTYNKAYETVLSQNSVQGRWSGKLGANSVLWDFDAAGTLAGTSTTGCTYSGTLILDAGAKSVLDAAITETCAGTAQSLSGIAILSTDKTGMSLAYITAAGAQGGVVLLAR
ncbi:hypothetical protein [Undibacterium sp.]|jgi:hypothetical protein|uniref:hypothetical protein n=1 Tax=Undibacterium sp. TaxID=1914977 RepID=UPI002C213AD7|nr:hypothetical protein [Undibacterium sp.]HTD06305.1 hypothetical protein [Undibacterium sp.]